MSLRSNYTQKRSPQYVQVSLALKVKDADTQSNERMA